MSFPWVHEANFELGDNSEWDSEDDGEGFLDFPHYSELARTPGMGMPYRGAYCCRIQPGDTNDHTLTEGDINITDGSEAAIRFYLWHDLAATADDTFNIFEFQASSTVELALSLKITAATGAVTIGLGESEASTLNATLLPKQWYCVEVVSTAQTGATSTLYIDEAAVQTLASHPSAAVTDGLLGTQNTLATTTGTILIDQFVFDDARVYPFRDRYPEEMLLTKSSHVFCGKGTINNVSLLSGAGTNCVLSLFDTDTADTTDAANIGVELKNTANNELIDPAGMPLHVDRGCYVTLSGTNPRALVQIDHAPYYAAGALRSYGLRRR